MRWRMCALLCAAPLATRAEDGPTEEQTGPQLSASLQATFSARGGREMGLVARLRRENIAISAGVESFAGPKAPELRGAMLAVEVEPLDGLGLALEAHYLPEQHEISRAAGELWVRHEWIGVGVLARTTSLAAQRLIALGAGLALDAEILAVEASLRLRAWRVELSGAGKKDPWTTFSQRTLDWVERWEAELSGRRALGIVALTAAVAVSQAPDPRLNASGSVGAELKLGWVTLSASAAAFQTAEGLAPAVSAGVALGAQP